MTKRKKVCIIIATVLISVTLVYLSVCLFSAKPGINGFAVTNGMIKMLVTDADYVKIGENKYIYREFALSKVIINEYDSYELSENDPRKSIPGYDIEYLEKYGNLWLPIVYKDGRKLMAESAAVWKRTFYGFFYLYYKPYRHLG